MHASIITLAPPLPATLAAPLETPPHAAKEPVGLPGIGTGALVRTLGGDKPVETLEPGATLVDSAGRVHSLLRRITLQPARARVVRIAPGALDLRGRLDRALVVGAAQAVQFDDWRTQLVHGGAAFVPAPSLCDDTLIAAEVCTDVVLHVLVTRQRAVIMVNGVRMLSATPAQAARLGAPQHH